MTCYKCNGTGLWGGVDNDLYNCNECISINQHLNDAKYAVCDSGFFVEDQINALHEMIDAVGDAIKSSIKRGGG